MIALIFNTLVMSLVSRWMAQLEYQQSWNRSQADNIFTALAIVRYAITAGGIALILFAVYSARSGPPVRRTEPMRDRDFPFDRPRRPVSDVLPAGEAPDRGFRERKE
jgi:hypothetical protein